MQVLSSAQKLSRSEAGKLGWAKSEAAHRRNWTNIRQAYDANPVLCNRCDKKLDYKHRENKFCSRTCATKATWEKGGYKTKTKSHVCVICGQPYEKGRTSSKRCSKCKNITINPHKSLEQCMTTASIKRRLIIERSHTCESCLNSVWMSNKIPLELDHVNGDSSDNKRENLRLICPNCHALTPTYKGKNKGKGRFSRRQRYLEGKSY